VSEPTVKAERAAKEFGYSVVRMVSEQLAVARWGDRQWYVLDMTGDKPAQLGVPRETRWEAKEDAEARVRSGDYK
jgi:hypothetical protein